jgi:D-alanyl-D-alanine carboxypeptidase (penicillin-binding protein 5/6)
MTSCVATAVGRGTIGRIAMAAVVVLGAVAPAWGFDTSAREAILVDDTTGTVLFEKNADQLMPPSSMSKIMTVYILFERLADGSVRLDDEFPVSERAWRMGGSKMFVEVGSRVKVADLLRGIVVQSGNDATIVVAEGLAGSEEAFAAQMNEKARELGMTNTHFTNASGWPEEGHLTTARDLAILAHATIRDFPQFYPVYAEKTFTFNEITQGNRNPLLYKDLGADGLKTGHAAEAGYGLTASAVRDGRRLILVLNGLPGVNTRAEEAERILDWGFRETRNYELFAAGATVAEADVWLGAAKTVPLVTEQAVVLTLSREARKGMQVRAVYDSPVPTPLVKGTPLGRLVVSAPGFAEREYPLVAGADVAKLSPFRRLGAAVAYLVWGAGGE